MEKLCNGCNKMRHPNGFSAVYTSLCVNCADELKFKIICEKYERKKYNQENQKEIRYKYYKERRERDPLFKLRCDISSKTNSALKSKKWNVNGGNKELLGADRETVIKHIESQFKLGMGWHNKGAWQIDHIVPLSSATNETQLYSLANYLNLSPKWKDENAAKAASIPNEVLKVGTEYNHAQDIFEWYYFKADCSMSIAKECAIYAVDLMLNHSLSHINYWERVKEAIKRIDTVTGRHVKYNI